MADDEKEEEAKEEIALTPAPECLTIRDELSALIDGQVSGSLKSQIEDHLGGCESCRHELDSLKQVQSFLAKAFSQSTEDTPDIWAKMAASVPSICDVIQEDLSAYLDGELRSRGNEEMRLGQQRFFQHEVDSYGVPMREVTALVR
ncbi:MAG TPA: zf-HC2 domain-containing protein, partial [Candidatus Obscuribacter sp.]|nr:zf-HC2 domain-containing protein [Candidatus Obscuribacter sp.]